MQYGNFIMNNDILFLRESLLVVCKMLRASSELVRLHLIAFIFVAEFSFLHKRKLYKINYKSKR